MRLRPVRSLPLLVALVAAVTPAVATAKPAKAPVRKPTCNLFKSPSSGGGVLDLTPEMDIISGDVASGKSELGGTLRLRSASWRTNPAARLGLRWIVRWEAKGNDYTFVMRYSGSGTETAQFNRNGTEIAKPTLKFNPGTKAIEWRVPRKVAPELNKQVFRKIGAATYRANVSQDGVDTTSTYTDQWPSCLKVK